MSLRLSGSSGYLLFQRSLQLRNADIYRSSEQLSTQKRINRPSDDPEGSKLLLTYRANLMKIDQYKTNIMTAEQNLKQTETVLGSVKDLMVRAKEIALQANNSTLSDEARETLAAEVNQLSQQLLGLGNSEVNGEYLFSGYKTDTAPFDFVAGFPNPPTANFNGDSNLKSIAVSEDLTLTVQVRGDLIFKGDGTAATVDLFEVLGNLETTLRTNINPAANPGDPDHRDTIFGAMGDHIEDLDTGFNQVLTEMTSLGGRQNRLTSTKDFFEVQVETMKTFISDIEDKDIAEITMEFQKAQLALQATLGSAGAVMNLPSLMDFIGR
jgi:flagellar hook-associated protein 3 FlgL